MVLSHSKTLLDKVTLSWSPSAVAVSRPLNSPPLSMTGRINTVSLSKPAVFAGIVSEEL